MGKFLVYGFRYSATMRRLLRAFVSATPSEGNQGHPDMVRYHEN